MRFDRFCFRFRFCFCPLWSCLLVAGGSALLSCEPAPLPADGNYVPVEFPLCSPNLDGRIDAAEFPVIVGATARVRVATNVPVDTAGAPAQGDARVWDLTRPDPADEAVGLLTTESMSGQWFENEFPDAQIASPLSPSADGVASVLGPLLIDATGVKLLGAASRDEAPAEGRTFLHYDQPVLLYPFPLSMGVHTQTVALAVNGVARGIPLAVEDTYSVDVSAHGEVRLPDLILQDALRVTIRLERVPVAGLAVQQVTQVFLNECVGEVARIVSPFVLLSEELPDGFDTAAEVWRLSF